jgi:hypothetical protein
MLKATALGGPTRRCSRPLRAEITAILDGGIMRLRRLNGSPLAR